MHAMYIMMTHQYIYEIYQYNKAQDKNIILIQFNHISYFPNLFLYFHFPFSKFDKFRATLKFFIQFSL